MNHLPPMTPKQSRWPRILGQMFVMIAAIAIAFFAGWFAHSYFGNTAVASGSSSRYYQQLFDQAWNTVDQNYVDRKAVDYKKMSYAAINAMVQSLNDTGHTRFMTPDQVNSENQALSGKFTGIGVSLKQDDATKNLIITSTIPGAPAEKAGIKRGDVILAVDGKSTKGLDIPGVSKLIQGKAGTAVALTVQHTGAPEPTVIKITRAEIDVPNVIMHYIPETHTAHIQIVQFAQGISDQLKTELAQAKKQGATNYILDLRDNGGGYLDEAINTASLFLKTGNVLLVQDSTGTKTPIAVRGTPVDTTSKLVVLINNNSASASEIVSAALQDNNRATLIGEHTFGTGTVLNQFKLDDGSAILIGTQEWLTPNGKFIRDNKIYPNYPQNDNRDQTTLPKGVSPIFPSDENSGNLTYQQILDSGDTQLITALKYLQQP